DSLGAVEIESRLQSALGVEVSIADLLAGASLADVAAAALVEIAAAATAAATPGTAAASGTPEAVGPRPEALGPAAGRFPLAYNQQALWFIHRLAPRSLAYHLAGAARVESPLDGAALGRALEALVARHPALRTTFSEDGEGPWQQVAEQGSFEPLELAAAAPDESDEALVERLRAAASRPFDLERGPLLRVGLLPDARQGAAGTGLLFVAIHHIVADFWSLQVLVRDLAVLYARETAAPAPAAPSGGPAPAPAAALPLPPLSLRYTDHVRWQRERLAGSGGERLLRHWRQALGGEPARAVLPTDRPWPKVQTWAGAAWLFELPEALTAGLETVARGRGATLFMLLLTAFQALLLRMTRGTEIVVGSPTHGRGGPAGAALADLVGNFVNLVPLASDLGGDPEFAALVTAVRATALAAYEHQEMPLGLLAERLLPERDTAHSPFFDAVFAFEKGRDAGLDLGGFALGMPGSRLRLGDVVLSSLAFAPAGAPFALSLQAAEVGRGGRGLGVALRYNTDLFDRATAARLAGHFRRLLAAAAEDPGRRLSELEILAPAERHQLLAGWNDTARAYPREATLAELFAAAAARAPEAVAVVCGERRLSYRELGRRADALARRLAALGVGPEVLVGVCVERSAELVVALLGVAKAGGAYLPLDPAWPAERLALLLATAGAPVLVTDGAGNAATLAEGAADTTDVTVVGVTADPTGDLAAAGTGETPADWDWRGAGDSLAYVMVTSGSTGEPKLVAVVHRAVARLVLRTDYACFGPEEVWLQLAPAAFDASTLEIWGALLHGGRLVIYPPGVPSPEELGEVLAAQRVSSLWLTAGLFQQMVETNVAGLAPLRQLLAGGEALPPAAVAKALAALPGCRLINGYGPTEGTTFTCCQILGAPAAPGARAASPQDPGDTVPIGRPIANTRVYLLDAALGPVAVGAVGELYAGGDGLARGYHRRPDLTAERFVPDPCGGEPGGRLYRTGDLARYLPDGRIQFLGRGDVQVKIRGFRIEPAEIEAALARHPAVAAAAVVAIPAGAADSSTAQAPGDLRLVAYVVAAGAGTAGAGTAGVVTPGAGTAASETIGATASGGGTAGAGAPGTGTAGAGGRAAPGAEELRAFLRERLPEPMVPAAYVWLAALPLTPNGKLDRRALPAPQWGRGEQDLAAPPRTPVEELLLGLWREVLGVERIGIHDSFFALGGHSLLAARLASRVRRAFDVELPLAALLEAPTVAGIAASIASIASIAAMPSMAARLAGPSAGAGFRPAGPEPIAPQPRPELPPLSFAQERLWFLDQLEPASATYNIPAALRLTGELAWAPLAGAITAIAGRHEALRTRFPEVAGRPVQRVEPAAPVPLPVIDLSSLAATAATAATGAPAARAAETARLIAREAARLAGEEAAAPFALAAGPPLRARLVALGGGEWHLLLSFHHIVFDGVSVAVFWRELTTFYGALAAGRPAALSLLPPLPIQYLDYTLWQRRRLLGPASEPPTAPTALIALIAHWRQALEGAPRTLALPTDRPRPAARSSRAGRRKLRPAPGAAGKVAALARRQDATPFMVLLAAFAALLGRAGGAAGPRAVVVGTPVANRDRLELEPLIGFFVNTLPLHVDLADDPGFAELLARVRRVALAAYAHQELPFEKLVEELAAGRDASRTPLFQAVLSFRDRAEIPLGSPGFPGLAGARAELLPPRLARAKFDLLLTLESGPEGLAGDLEYSADLYDAATAERLLGHFRRLLAAAVEDPGRRLSELPMLAPAERHQLLAGWNDTARDYPREATLAELFATAAARAPEAVAVVCGERRFTYRELGRRADALAHRLAALGVGPEVLVGVCVERSAELVVALLGVAKAGGAYLPLDPAWPAERLAMLVATAGAPVLVTDGTGNAATLAEAAAGAEAATGPMVVRIAGDLAGDPEAAETREAPADWDWRGAGDSLAYVMVTSGSTGEPKLVAVVHRAVARLVLGASYACFGPEEVWLQLAPAAFDASTLEIWGALLHGGRLVIYPPGVPSPEELG
ncbi:MAG TPA: amino acid adenylation domain-containing protein, partial [Thermoanaerobaculia bacterium]